MMIKRKYRISYSEEDSNLVSKDSFRNSWEFISQHILDLLNNVRFISGNGSMSRIRFLENVEKHNLVYDSFFKEC